MKTANLIEQFDPDKQREMDQLLEKNQHVALDKGDATRLRELVDNAERLMVRNAEVLASIFKPQASAIAATPVTVWVKPEASVGGYARKLQIRVGLIS